MALQSPIAAWRLPFQAVAPTASSKQWAAVIVYSRIVLGSCRPYPREQAVHRSDPPSLTRIIARPPADQGARSSIRPNGRDCPSTTTLTGTPAAALSRAAVARTSIAPPRLDPDPQARALGRDRHTGDLDPGGAPERRAGRQLLGRP